MPSPFLRAWRFIRIPVYGACITVPPALVMLHEAHTYRSRSSLDVDFHEEMRGVDRRPDNALERWLYRMTMAAELGFVSSVFKAIMGFFHETEVLEHGKLLGPLLGCVHGGRLWSALTAACQARTWCCHHTVRCSTGPS